MRPGEPHSLRIQRGGRGRRGGLAPDPLDDERVWLVREGVELEVDLESVEPGDTVAVYEHHRIPVDGHVLTGEALVDQAAVTGEMLPSTPGKAPTSTPAPS